MLKKTYVIVRVIRRTPLLRNMSVIGALVTLSWLLACGSLGKSQQEVMIREEVEKRPFFIRIWDELGEVSASENITLWAVGYVYGIRLTRMHWTILPGEGRTEVCLNPSCNAVGFDAIICNISMHKLEFFL